jgi:hypothetical protein
MAIVSTALIGVGTIAFLPLLSLFDGSVGQTADFGLVSGCAVVIAVAGFVVRGLLGTCYVSDPANLR